MMDLRSRWLLALALTAMFQACASEEAAPPPPSEDVADADDAVHSALRDALTFHASFDESADADYARGDTAIYTAASYDDLASAEPGIGNPDVQLAPSVGRFGGALDFGAKNEHAIFYNAEGNAAYGPADWSGTISFWLELDPAVDLEPGFCDPIQITDSRYNDAAVWVDFTRDNPRQFRLGVFGDLAEWNPEELSADEFPFFGERLIVVDDPPFSREGWTHVVITYSGLNRDEGGTARLYLDGVPRPEVRSGINEPFTWDNPGTIRLGINYVGLYDELALFNRALTPEEVQALHALEGGIADLS